MALSWRSLQQLLDIVARHSADINMELNTRKSVCMVFNPRNRSRVLLASFPQFSVNGALLSFVSSFKYLGHIISGTNADDADIQREITNMFVRTNILLHRFSLCSNNVKTVLFKTYCLCMYDVALWKIYNLGTLGKLRSCYHRCVKIFFGYRRRDSMTSILLTLGLPSFNTVLANASISFAKQWANCSNRIIRVMRNMDLNYWE